jgi:peptidoglycan/LPS O-acetylase OafA/YrhL
MVFVILNFLVALVLGFGAVQELIVPGIRGGATQPFVIGVAGIFVSVLFIMSGVAMLRKWPSSRRLVIITAIASILFHVYAALPPHRNVGPPALIIGAGYGLVLLIITLASKGRKTEAIMVSNE